MASEAKLWQLKFLHKQLDIKLTPEIKKKKNN